MKTITLIFAALALNSCTFSGTYHSATGQKFNFDTTIIIPVEDCKK